ncbi:MAG: VWA domain-containing protein [Anaerolineales bacterium]
MSFLWPSMLPTLLLLPVFIGLYMRVQARRKKAQASFQMFGVARDQAGHPVGRRRHVPPLLFLTGLTLLLLALARPEATVTLPRVEGSVILAFDVSGSMAADDLDPSRMEAAKAAAQKFVENQPPSVLIGVVAFSDAGFSIQPPTNDKEAIYAAIHRLTPQRGTSLANGMIASLNVLVPNAIQAPEENPNANADPLPTPTPLPPGTYAPGIIILLTDGENNLEPDPFAVAEVAANLGVRVYTIGIGSTAGTELEIDDFLVHTALDEETLQQIAEMTEGQYFNAQNEEDLEEIYAGLDPQLVVRTERIEVTSILTGISLLFLMAGGAISLVWFGRLP